MRLIDADKLTQTINKALETPCYSAYNDGYDMALNTILDYIEGMPTASAYGQWVSVKDRLPEVQKEVLIYLPEYDSVEIAALFEIPSLNLKEWTQNEDAYMLNEVSHWMPLPEPPDERYKCRYVDDNGVCSKCSGNGEIIYCVEGPCPYMFEEVRDDGKSKLD